MPRSRNIKHSFFNNDSLADNDPLGRLLFIGLWTIADYKGELEWRAKRIKATLLPYDDCDIEKLAINLDKSGFIRFYSDGESDYIKIVNFTKHQNPHKNEKDKGSEIPSYNEEMRQAIDFKGIMINRDKSRINHEDSHSDPADSCSLIPDSCSLNKELFEEFWNAGLPKTAKKKAGIKFESLLKGQKDKRAFTDQLVFDIQWRLQNNQFGFDKMHPTTYLNGERWNDERRIQQPSKSIGGKPSLAERSAEQTAIIQARIAAGEFDQRPMGQNGAALPAQMEFSGRGEDQERTIDAEFFDVVPQNGGLNG